MLPDTASSHDKCIDIYPSTGRLVRVMLCGLVFAIIGFFMIQHPRRTIELVAGYAGIVLGVLAVIVGIADLILGRRGYPTVRIFDDRIESFVPIKKKYQALAFDDVLGFIILDLHGTKIIRAKLTNGKSRDTALQSSLVPHLADLCQLLNDRLAAYRRRPRSR